MRVQRLEMALSVGYGFPVDLTLPMQSLEAVAKALNDNDACRAAIALVQAQFPPLPEVNATRKMTAADALSKGDAYPTQPRVPPGQAGAGQWTGEGASAPVDRFAAQRRADLRRLSGRLNAARIIADGVLPEQRQS